MSNSTKNMLTKMNPNVKLSRAPESSSSKKPAAQKSGSKSKPMVENPKSNSLPATAPAASMPPTLKPKLPTVQDMPANELQNLMEMCLSPKNNKKPKPTSSKA